MPQVPDRSTEDEWVVSQLFAYVDPTIGATLTQLLLAGAVGVGAVIKLKWHSIKRMVGRGKADLEASEGVESVIEDDAHSG